MFNAVGFKSRMTTYIHHVPGRLRVRSSFLRRNDIKARTTQAHLTGQNGILSAEVNATTGSLLIHYDTSRIDVQSIFQSLRSLGITHHSTELYRPHTVQTAMAQAADGLTDRFASKLVEAVLERSAVALVAALI